MTCLPKEASPKRLGLVIDLGTCVGCYACVTNCKEWNGGAMSAPLTDINDYQAEQRDGPFAGAAIMTAGMTVGTVACTAMIYASLTPIRQGNNPWTLPVYLMLAAYTGAPLFVALTVAFGAF